MLHAVLHYININNILLANNLLLIHSRYLLKYFGVSSSISVRLPNLVQSGVRQIEVVDGIRQRVVGTIR